MITNVEYMQIVNEVYDLSDYKTKKAILFCNEAEKVNNVNHIVENLYQHIKNDVNGIDFRSISRSKGIITNVENYDQMVDCINTVSDMVAAYGEKTTPIDVFSTAIENIRSRERFFAKAFALNIEFPMMIYNTTVMSIVSAISLLITASIEFIKEGHESFKASLDKAGYKKTQHSVQYEYLIQFNKSCANGTIDKINNMCIKNNIVATKENAEIVDESIGSILGTIASGSVKSAIAGFAAAHPVVAVIVGVGAVGIIFLWTMRKTIYYLLRANLSISEWFDAQATYLQINADNLKYREDEKGDEHKKKIYQKQIKWVERFKKISNMFALKNSKAEKETNDEEEKSKRRRTDDDDESSNDGGLF